MKMAISSLNSFELLSEVLLGFEGALPYFEGVLPCRETSFFLPVGFPPLRQRFDHLQPNEPKPKATSLPTPKNSSFLDQGDKYKLTSGRNPKQSF